MSIRIECGGCHKHLSVPDDFQGKRVRCPVCKSILPPVSAQADPPVPAAGELVSVMEKPAGATQIQKPAREGSPRALARAAGTPARVAGPGKRFHLGRVLAGLAVGIVFVAVPGAALFWFIDWNSLRPTAQPPQAQAEAPLPPPPQLDEVPDGPAPREMAAETRTRVLRATAMLKVTRAGNLLQQGSGFFAAEPGLVITNAHVVGMASSGCSTPKTIDVILNAGTPEEIILQGHVVAADWANDLAVLRVSDPEDRCPPPLRIPSRSLLSKAQTVYLPGTPLAASTGQLKEATVAVLSKGPFGNVINLQFTGSMHPAQSGAPVVDSRGIVVAVAVANVIGTSRNVAVPAEKLHNLLRGSLQTIEIGDPYLDGSQVRLSVSLTCLDPMRRLRELKVDTWTGKPGAVRPPSLQPPQAQPGDGARASHVFPPGDGKRTVQIPLPVLKAGEVLWFQPVLTDTGGTTRWFAAASYKPPDLPPLERTPVVLRLDLGGPAEHTLQLTSTSTYQLRTGDTQTVRKLHLEGQALEVVRPEAGGGEVQVCLGPCKATREGIKQPADVENQAMTLIPGRLLRYTIDAQGRPEQRGTPVLDSEQLRSVRLVFEEALNQLANSCEAASLTFPNRRVQPLETWAFRTTLLTLLDGQKQVLDLRGNCTFEGCRTIDGDRVAVISLSGTVFGGVPYRILGGLVTGQVHVSLSKGYVSRASLRIVRELGTTGFRKLSTFEVLLTRVPGNQTGLVPPQEIDLRKGKWQITSLKQEAGNGQ